MENQKLISESITMPAVYVRYGKILCRERPVHNNDLFSRRHPKMPLLNRAKLFAPFAALDGFENRIRNKETIYVPKHELDADEEWELNETLYQLHLLTANSRLARTNAVGASVEYFSLCSDPENDAYGTLGQYQTVIGTVQKVDAVSQALVLLTDGTNFVLPFADIFRIVISST